MIKIGDKEIIIKKGDITNESSDAIVNASNGMLKHAGGVAAAIVKKGGREVQEESNKIVRKEGIIPTGGAVITKGYNLPCKYIIHAVGPRMGEGDEEIKLKNAILSALCLAEQHNLKSLSVPAVSSGIFGFSKERCANILINTAIQFLNTSAKSLKRIIMCNLDDETYKVFLNEEKKILNK
ncbi:Appr-1-p processing protein [Clostridium botulinum]|uniref:Appr-1-p processing protein n=1 Tax=Clostridium botulinum C/D str. DC5 TaxID=1443128 RepID=A0A0A0IGY6_CLOBO|nr:macro domain-containing protein [Clostridium botulinum]KEI01768.1 Appr-1-p processing protein [Clostridium botulinum C/D str. BKT75002]KEI07416.1 Appr-1-p processing protein [Clostridium botulinum C/D str. BKT2873]KGM93293.1 Appr-1-p processing protein [Clostridium botulinum D str. CCUG 7971]KGM99853.1 Appr-1-p processing protein [Clostridium botulinum C/D str. DC5]KOC49335.1 Appr-1-p processing protein [Clostridium botulinum]